MCSPEVTSPLRLENICAGVGGDDYISDPDDGEDWNAIRNILNRLKSGGGGSLSSNASAAYQSNNPSQWDIGFERMNARKVPASPDAKKRRFGRAAKERIPISPPSPLVVSLADFWRKQHGKQRKHSKVANQAAFSRPRI